MVVVLAVAVAPRVAPAQGIVLESYTGTRPEHASQLLAPLHDELAARGYLGGDSVGRKYEARVSRPPAMSDGLTSDFDSGIERGHRAWIGGRFDEAVSALVPLIAAAHANPIAIAQNQALREKLQKGLIALALSHHRKGDLAEAKSLIGEIVRSFPDVQVSRAAYGPDAYELFEDTRRALGKAGRGRLTVKVPTEAAVVFVNERFENVGSISKGDLLPGTYRVYVQIAKQVSRAHKVEVKADEDSLLAIDTAYDSALRTSGTGVGFVFPDAKSRDRDEPRYAARFATQVGASGVVVVGIDQVRNRPALVGSVIDLRTPKEIRRASLALEPTPSIERIRALAAFLAGDEAAEGLEVEIGAAVDDPEHEPVESTGSRAWMLWSGIAGMVLGATVGGGVAAKFVFDGRDAAAELDRVCAMSCTSEQALALEQRQTAANRNALIAGVAGGAVFVTGAVFVVVSRFRPSDRGAVAVVPTAGGFHASYAVSF